MSQRLWGWSLILMWLLLLPGRGRAQEDLAEEDIALIEYLWPEQDILIYGPPREYVPDAGGRWEEHFNEGIDAIYHGGGPSFAFARSHFREAKDRASSRSIRAFCSFAHGTALLLEGRSLDGLNSLR